MKTTKKNLFHIWMISAVLMALITSCQKEASTTIQPPPGKQSVAIYLNDDPVPNLYKVLIDVRYIEVKIDTGTEQHNDEYYDDDKDSENDHKDHDRYGKWDTLSIIPKIYDLLRLRNGVDTLIANGFVNAGKITKVRITLGSNNTIWTDSLHSFPLPLCENEPYLYVRIESKSIETLPNGQVRLRIDFDVAESIEMENGAYCLKPKLISYSDQTTGKIEGTVKPGQAHAVVKVYSTTDTAYAIPEEDGEYKIKGLKPALYTILFKAMMPYRDSIIANVRVTAGNETKLSLVMLHQ